MLRRIHEDTRLLVPVRELVQGLKPALLQLARSDPRFFADRQNPARRLLDTLTARSLAFTSEQDNGFAAFAQQLKDTAAAMMPIIAIPTKTATTAMRTPEAPPPFPSVAFGSPGAASR